MRRPFPFILIVLCGIGIDLISKWYVFRYFSGGLELLPGILHLTTAENKGVAFSWFKDRPVFILAVSSVAIAAIAWLYARSWREARAPMLVALGLLLTGAIGNLIDRIYFGHVRDFIDFVPRIPLVGHWAIFNFADICITTGVVLFVVTEVFLQKPQIKDNERV